MNGLATGWWGVLKIRDSLFSDHRRYGDISLGLVAQSKTDVEAQVARYVLCAARHVKTVNTVPSGKTVGVHQLPVWSDVATDCAGSSAMGVGTSLGDGDRDQLRHVSVGYHVCEGSMGSA